MKKEELEKLRETWRSRLQEWKESGLTQVEYCRRNNVKIAQFLYWNKKFSDKKRTLSSFVQVPIQAANRSCPLRIEIGNRFSVEVGHGCDPAALEQVIGILSRS